MAHKLLLADDSITIQKVVSLTFAEEDFEVICVGNGEIAIEKIRELRPEIVLADIFMPRRTGYEVCEYIKTTPEHRHIPVILLVGTFEPFDKNEAARVGADGYLTKPFETTVLIKMVQQAVSKAQSPAAAAPAAVRPRPVEAAPLDYSGATQQISVEELRRKFDASPLPPAPPLAELDEILEIPVFGSRPPGTLDLEKTLKAETLPGLAPTLEPDEVLLASEEEVLVAPTMPPPPPVAEPAAPTAAGSGFVTGVPEEPPAEILLTPVPPPPVPAPPPEEEWAEPLAIAQPEPVVSGNEIDVLECPVIQRKVVIPSEEDILGIFDTIHLDAIIARQRSLEEELRQQMEAPVTAPVATAEPEAVEVEEPAIPEPVLFAQSAVEEAPPAAVTETPAAVEPEPAAALDETAVIRIARMVVEKLSEKTIRDIVWEVVPELAEIIIRREIERMKEEGKL